MVVRFICGCAHEVKPPKDELYDPVMLDSEGFVICAAHKTRRVAWRATISTVGGGRTGAVRPGWTDLEKEQWEVWGQMPSRPTVNIHPAEHLDRREHRDFTPTIEKVLAKTSRKRGSVRRAVDRAVRDGKL